MFEQTKTLTGRLGLWGEMMRDQVVKGLPSQLMKDLSEAKSEIERLRAKCGECLVCLDEGWVCEEHPDKSWNGGDGCCGGAGMPCPHCEKKE